jgi:ankyrin repeat protein
VDSHGDTPLLLAVRRRDQSQALAAIVETLTSYGANVNAASNDGHTPLSIAVERDLPQVVDLLRAHGALVGTTEAPTE